MCEVWGCYLSRITRFPFSRCKTSAKLFVERGDKPALGIGAWPGGTPPPNDAKLRGYCGPSARPLAKADRG